MMRPILGDITNITLGQDLAISNRAIIPKCFSFIESNASQIKSELKLEQNFYNSVQLLRLQRTKNILDLASSWDDLDQYDDDDPMMCCEYVTDIFEYLYDLETKNLPRNYNKYNSTGVLNNNRDVLINWIVRIHQKFQLLEETLYLCINIIDRFEFHCGVRVDELQLLGICALLIACKIEEVFYPSIQNFSLETDGVCSEEAIKKYEHVIMSGLDYNFMYANPLNFLRRISKADGYDNYTRTIAKYLLEITAIDSAFIGNLPSLNAATALFFSRKMLKKGPWTKNLIFYSGGYTSKELIPVCEKIMVFLLKPIVHEDFHRKYQSRTYYKASIICSEWAEKMVKRRSKMSFE
ncbi:uncharacterized protein KNAG_0B00970 [Huiozyma naganishii CBS 8797]|uniref:Uncharacterized protein n=1 Tax=Huiozyma naganishii (strain ATCC MYA-139 / BCRC 22969 / CBS 8797 / KCTC 17520 / NBRC 10181 / NCYC 3082 / Yp74L-3) TaxID=1071383 RepID=J7S377_HUIN7|nr:hypothetical protein KNAG_0B00970 [Kazachstania naganishii CBS 8797]CCK68544.1 hypothetical protein KNAG_0B00970 [Kazachstania naganishii CBS 8797]